MKRPCIYLGILTALNAVLTFLYLDLIKRVGYFWYGLLEKAEYPAITKIILNYGSAGMLAFLIVSMLALTLSVKERSKEDQTAWTLAFAGITLSEIVYLTFVALGLTLPAIQITTHLEG